MLSTFVRRLSSYTSVWVSSYMLRYKLNRMIYGYIYIFFQPAPQDGLVINAKMNVDSVSNSMLVTMLMEVVPKVVSKVSKEIYAKHVRLLFFKLSYTLSFLFYCMKRQETTFLFCAKHLLFSFAACSDGEFGKDCTFNCSGNCLNMAVCEKYKGTCESCSSGYRGSRCDKRKPSYSHQQQGMKSMISRLARMLFQFYKQKRALTKNKTSMLYRNLQNP